MNSQSIGIPRHWWGKIIGAVLGMLRGGLTGAIIGGIIGHFFDRFLLGLTDKSRTRTVFFRALFSSLGHINKADGRVTETEIASAEELMRRLQLNEDERREAIGYFRQGRQADFKLEGALHEFAMHSVLRHDLRQMFMEILLDGAAADGRISSAEQAVLLRVCRALHIPADLFAAMLSAHSAAGGHGQYSGASPGRQGLSLPQAYASLGISESATDTEVKRAYRKLVGQYHPDKLVSRGLPEEMMAKARARVREINTAYDQVKQARGFK